VIGYGTLQSPPQGEEKTSLYNQNFHSCVIEIADFDIDYAHRVKNGIQVTPIPDFLLRGKKLWTPSSIAAE